MSTFRIQNRNTHRGVGLVEAIVVISIASVAFASLLSSAVFLLRGGLASADRAQALYLLEEGVEAIRFLRDQGYTTNITPLIGSGTFYLAPTTGGFEATSTSPVELGQYARSVTLSRVHRRVSDNDIVPSTSSDPKAVDSDTTLLSITVSWASGSVDTQTYVTNIYDN
jgi:Tfp pilus assembly protein PilV